MCQKKKKNNKRKINQKKNDKYKFLSLYLKKYNINVYINYNNL